MRADQNIVPDSQWVETHPVGEYKVNATYQIRNGIQIPWATRVTVEGEGTFVEVKGHNLLPKAILIAETLADNHIAD